METITTHLPAPVELCTAFPAYKAPIKNIVMLSPIPPYIVLCRRPHLSAHIRAGIVTPKITRAETPEAKKLASVEASPAC